MKAMVLCAGFGTRLGDLTREIPKPMLDVNGAPILKYILSNLKRHGFNRIAVNLHFKPELIRNYFGTGEQLGLELNYSMEAELLGTAGGVKNLEDFFKLEPFFLVQYGDVITDQNLTELVSFHRQRDALATLLLHQRTNSNSVVSLDSENRIIGFLERPTEGARQGIKSPWVNSGICICSPEILEFIPPGQPADLPRDIFPGLLKSGRVWGFPLTGYRCAVDSPERLISVRAALIEGRCSISV